MCVPKLGKPGKPIPKNRLSKLVADHFGVKEIAAEGAIITHGVLLHLPESGPTKPIHCNDHSRVIKKGTTIIVPTVSENVAFVVK